MTTYDPNNSRHRAALGSALTNKLVECGFAEVSIPGTKEKVFERAVEGTERVFVRVFTSVTSRGARRVGKDAIRVCGVYKANDGKVRGIAKADKRVNRVGEVEAIVGRMYDRMREVYKLAATGERCSCGAPKFKSKAGNLVCADLCWLKKSPSRSSRRRSGGYDRSTGYRSFSCP
jgi:hypothetical protein